MKKLTLLTRRLVFCAFATATMGAGQAVAQQVGCCVAGSYKGYIKDTPSKTCPKPANEKFVMEIDQAQLCGAKIKGKVTNLADGNVNNFTGTVVPRQGDCCTIEGGWKKPDEITTFTGTLCQQGNTWSGKGTYVSKYGKTTCNGVWQMQQ